MTQKAFFSILGILIVFGFGYLPPIAPLTAQGMTLVGIFLGVIILWSFVDILWPSLLGLIALLISEYTPLGRMMSIGFANVSLLVMLSMILFGAIQQAGVTHYISRAFLSCRFIDGRPYLFSFMFLFTTFVLCALAANVLPILLFMWGILYDVLKDLGYKKGEKYATLMVIGCVFATMCGQGTKPFLNSTLLMTGAYEKVAGQLISYPKFMLMNIILSIAAITAFTLFMKYVLRPDSKKMECISVECVQRDELPPMTKVHKIMFAVLFSFLTLIIVPGMLPTDIIGVKTLNSLGAIGVTFLMLVILTITRVEGKPIFNFKEVAAKSVIWDVYFLVAVVMILSDALTLPTTGITELLELIFEPVLGGHSALAFVVILLIVSSLLTQFTNNGITGVLLMPVIKIFSEQTGVSFEGTATLVILILHVAMITPAASPYAAVMFGNTDWLEKGETMKYSFYAVLVLIATYICVGYPLLGIFY